MLGGGPSLKHNVERHWNRISSYFSSIFSPSMWQRRNGNANIAAVASSMNHQQPLQNINLMHHKQYSQIDWQSLTEYAYKSNLLKFSDEEIRDFIKLYDTNVDTDSILVRNVHSCGQRYVSYLTYDADDDLHQYVIVRGTKNWKNIKTSLQYSLAYNNEFEMYLHNGYGTASHAVLQDLQPFIHPNAKLNFTGHSYGGIVCCCIASKLYRNGNDNVNEIVTFGMPQFSSAHEMNKLSRTLPILQVRHIRDEIAKFDWNQRVRGLSETRDCNEHEQVVYVGHFDENTDRQSPIKKRLVHRMSDYVGSIEKHNIDFTNE